MDRENREEMREKVPVRKRVRKARGKERKQKAMRRGTGDPLDTLGLADITRHSLEGDQGGRCCNLNFPDGSWYARSAASGKNNNTWSVCRTAHRNVARGTRAGCQPAASARTWDAVACRESRLPPTTASHAGSASQLAAASLPRSRMQRSAVLRKPDL
jgi:hypothetical protein